MKYLIKRSWVEDLDTGIPIYQEAFVYRASQSSRLPGLKRFEGDIRGFLHRDTEEEAKEALKWVLDRYRQAKISVRKNEWQVVQIG